MLRLIGNREVEASGQEGRKGARETATAWLPTVPCPEACSRPNLRRSEARRSGLDHSPTVASSVLAFPLNCAIGLAYR